MFVRGEETNSPQQQQQQQRPQRGVSSQDSAGSRTNRKSHTASLMALREHKATQAWQQNKATLTTCLVPQASCRQCALSHDSVQSDCRDRLYRLWLSCHMFHKRHAAKTQPSSFLHRASYFHRGIISFRIFH